MSTPKATQDRVHRAKEVLGPTRRKKEHNGRRRKSLVPHKAERAAVLRKPTGSKLGKFDSTRGGNRAPISECIQFLGQHINGDIEKFGLAVEGFKHRKVLKDVIDHIVAVSEDGWRFCDGRFVHESGRVAFVDNWVLVNGRICPKGRGPVNFKSGWILEARARL